MKLLPDESVPALLWPFIPDLFEIGTVPRMGWIGGKNADLPL